jgi:hypothetical protein
VGVQGFEHAFAARSNPEMHEAAAPRRAAPRRPGLDVAPADESGCAGDEIGHAVLLCGRAESARSIEPAH